MDVRPITCGKSLVSLIICATAPAGAKQAKGTGAGPRALYPMKHPKTDWTQARAAPEFIPSG